MEAKSFERCEHFPTDWTSKWGVSIQIEEWLIICKLLGHLVLFGDCCRSTVDASLLFRNSTED